MLHEPIRRVYTRHLREWLRATLFDDGRVPIVTRQELLEDSPPEAERVWHWGDPEHLKLTEPVLVNRLPDEIAAKVGTWEVAPPFVVVCRDVQLVGPDAIPVAADNAYILESVEGSTARVTDAMVRSLLDGVVPGRRRTDEVLESAVSLAGPWSDQFFHWFVEYLPRVIAVDEFAAEASIDPVFLVPANPPDWLSRSLDLLGVPEDKIRPWRGGRVNVRQLVVPSLWRATESTAPPEGYINSPRGIREVSTRLTAAVSNEVTDRATSGRLYVSRSRASTRDITNETDLQPVLEDYGFEVVHPEMWSLNKQIATFSNADVIAGPHGGGLTNAIYASEPTVLEFFGSVVNPCYYALYAGRGWDYGFVTGDAVGADIRVDPDDFRKLCDRMLD